MMGEPQTIFIFILFASVFGAMLAGVPIAFALSGASLLVAFIASMFGVFDLSILAAIPSRIFGTAMFNEVLSAVPLFVLMGVIMERSHVAESLLTNMARLSARLPGGLGISVMVVGTLLAASTGIVGATVVAMGLLSLPTLLKQGYKPSLAAGSICAAGTLGQIIPPSIVLVFLGDQLSAAYMQAQREIGNFSPDPVSVGDLFAGALIPGLGLALLFIFYQFLIGVFKPKDAPSIPLENLEDVSKTGLLLALLPPVLLILLVLGSILFGIATPTEAAGIGALGATLLAGLKLIEEDGRHIQKTKSWMRKIILLSFWAGFSLPVIRSLADLRITLDIITLWNGTFIALALIACCILAIGTFAALWIIYKSGQLQLAMDNTVRISTLAFVILIGATIFTLIFRSFGGDELVVGAMAHIPGGPIGAVIAVSILIFLLGFFLDFIEIIFIIMPIVAPIILQSDINPIWFGILIAMNLQTSFLTPPFGYALFYFRSVAPRELKTAEIYRGVVPFICIQLFALILVFCFPQLVTWLPSFL